MNSRVVNNAKVTQYYSNNHKALDIVGDKTIKSYDDGVVIRVVTGHKNDIGSTWNNTYNGYAGIYGKSINAIQIRF